MEFPSEQDKKAYKSAKKSVRMTRIMFVILTVISILLGIYVAAGFFSLALFWIFIGLFMVGKTKKQFKRSFCSSCHAHYDYEEDIEWAVTDERVTSSQNSASRKANVEFTCHCPNCGKEKTFTEKFVVATVDSNGRVQHNNIQSMAKKYFF